MQKFSKILLATIFGACCSLNAKAATTEFTAEQTKQIQNIVHDYLLDNPKIFLEVGKKLQQQQLVDEKARIENIKKELPKFKTELFTANKPGRAIAGNPNGKIILVELMQYQCGHCRITAPIIDGLLKQNPDLELLVIQWPFFGDEAIYASKAALAAQKQGKFSEMHHAFVSTQEPLTKENVDKIANTITGLDVKKLHADMNAAELDRGLKANFKLAEGLNLIGTPTFIFANRSLTKFSLIPGQTQDIEADLKKSLDEVR